MNENFLTADKFAALLEETMRTKQCTIIDGIIEICAARGLDVEAVPELLTPKLKKQIQGEAADLHMMKRKKPK